MCESNGEDVNGESCPFFYCRKIKAKDIKDALDEMKNRKIVGPNSIPIDA